MFSCFSRDKYEVSENTEEAPPKSDSDIYSLIEEEIFLMTENINLEMIINEIIFYTRSNSIGLLTLKKILKENTDHPDFLFSLFSQIFIFIKEPQTHYDKQSTLYNDFNIQLIILAQLNFLPNENQKLDNFKDYIKDISIAMPDLPENSKFISITIIFFFILFSNRKCFEEKMRIFFSLLSPNSIKHIDVNKSLNEFVSLYVKFCLFFLDIEFNSRLKKEVLKTTNTQFFIQGKLENIIFFKKILLIYHNLDKSIFDDMVLYFLHNMILKSRKAKTEIEYSVLLRESRSRGFDLLILFKIRNFMLKFFTYNKTFYTIHINAIKQFILHFESIYNNRCTDKVPKPKITNQEHIIRFNLINNLKILEDTLKNDYYYTNFMNKAFYLKKIEEDEINEMLITSSSYTKSSVKYKKSVIKSNGFKTEKDNQHPENELINYNLKLKNNQKRISERKSSTTPLGTPNFINNLIDSPNANILNSDLEGIPDTYDFKSEIRRKTLLRKDHVEKSNCIEINEIPEEEYDNHNDLNSIEIQNVVDDKKKSIENNNQMNDSNIDKMLINNSESYIKNDSNVKLSNEVNRQTKSKNSNKNIKSDEAVDNNENKLPFKQSEDNNFKIDQNVNKVTPIDIQMTPYENDIHIPKRKPSNQESLKDKKQSKSNIIEEINKSSASKQSLNKKNDRQSNQTNKEINNSNKESKPKNIEIEHLESKQSIKEHNNIGKRISTNCICNEEVNNPINQSKINPEIIEKNKDIINSKFVEGNNELSEIEKAVNNEIDSDESILKNFNMKTKMKDSDMSMNNDSEIRVKDRTQRQIDNSRDKNFQSKKVNPISNNPFSRKEIRTNSNNHVEINKDILNDKKSKEPIDIILGQRETKKNVYQNIENSNYNDKMDLNLESLNIVLKQNKNQQSILSNHKNLTEKQKNDKLNKLNPKHQSSSEIMSSKENNSKVAESKSSRSFGKFLESYLENFNKIDTSSLTICKSGLNMLGIKTLLEKLKEKIVSKKYSTKLTKLLRKFSPNEIKDILDCVINVNIINFYFSILQINNDYLAETKAIEKVKIFDISLFQNLTECFSNRNFEPMMPYFLEEDIFKIYKKIIIPIYVENVENDRDSSENLILLLFDINANMINFYDAKGRLLLEVDNYKNLFETCFKYMWEKNAIEKNYINWKTSNDEAIPDFLEDYSVTIILYVAEKFSAGETVVFDNDNIDAENWNQRIFAQVSDFFIRLNRY